jgi:hypothetical protein
LIAPLLAGIPAGPIFFRKQRISFHRFCQGLMEKIKKPGPAGKTTVRGKQRQANKGQNRATRGQNQKKHEKVSEKRLQFSETALY